MTTPDETGLAYRKVTGNFMVSVEDSDDADVNPDQYQPQGEVTATPVLPSTGAFRRSTPSGSQLVIPKTASGVVENGILKDEQGNEGLTLLSQVGDQPVYWSVKVEIKDNNNWVIYSATYRIGAWPEEGVHLPDLVDVEVVPEPELAAIRSAQAARDEIVALLEAGVGGGGGEPSGPAIKSITHSSYTPGFVITTNDDEVFFLEAPQPGGPTWSDTFPGPDLHRRWKVVDHTSGRTPPVIVPDGLAAARPTVVGSQSIIAAPLWNDGVRIRYTMNSPTGDYSYMVLSGGLINDRDTATVTVSDMYNAQYNTRQVICQGSGIFYKMPTGPSDPEWFDAAGDYEIQAHGGKIMWLRNGVRFFETPIAARSLTLGFVQIQLGGHITMRSLSVEPFPGPVV